MITGVVLARNEERNIVGCLEALRPHVSELFLIDMESTDRTVELAQSIVHRVLRHPLMATFDAARNIAIPEARNEWLWFVDADERIPERTGQFVNQLIREQGHEFEAINIAFKSYFCGQWMQHCGWWPGFTMPRVLKRGYFRFAERLHGGVELTGKEIRLAPEPAWCVDHYSYRDVEHYLEKINRYTSVEASQLAGQNRTWDWQAATRHMMHELWQGYERNEGKHDRERGWLLCWLGGQYRWLTHAKLVDANGPRPDDLTTNNYPSDLDQVILVMQSELDRLRANRPETPLGIVWRSPLWDPSGYAEESRCFAKALATGQRYLAIEDQPWSDKTCSISPAATSLLKALTRARRPRHSAVVTNCICTLATPDPRASLNILRTTFETDRVPDHWHSHLNAFDEIWVISRHNEMAFRRSGVAPERLRVVPSCVDTDVYCDSGPTLDLPATMQRRFVFLSVFEWQLRKGWDLLLSAYASTFSVESGSGLLLKISRAHGYPLSVVHEQANQALSALGQTLESRPDIVIWDEDLSEQQMAALYRSVGAFVLPSRGEGWGRPYMEAMASGLPTIGTGASGNVDFMSESNSFLIPAELVDVPDAAVREISVYAGQKWYEPDVACLCAQLRTVFENPERRKEIGKRSRDDIRSSFGLAAGASAVEQSLQLAEERFRQAPLPPPQDGQLRVVLEGEFLAAHSFANVNERLLSEFLQEPSLAMGTQRVYHQKTCDNEIVGAYRLRPALERSFEEPQVTIRHAFPPNWQPPVTGHWVHIQPWEYGHLPVEWLAPLRDDVDEIWAPSEYVRKVYTDSGVPAHKIQVIPWGVDPEVFTPAAPARHLPTAKTFRFLFVGGTIPRKGFDLLLAAYLAEFRRADDVCLVIKDIGTQTFYRDVHSRDSIWQAAADPECPEIVYLDEAMSPGQLASLYTSCQCFAAPYRGEGFGLPILEAMACGLVPIVPQGGASDDYTDDQTAIRLPSRVVDCSHTWPLCGPATELSIELDDIRAALRQAYEQRDRVRELGLAASKRVHRDFTWVQTVRRMTERLKTVSKQPLLRERRSTERRPIVSPPSKAPESVRLCAYLTIHNDELVLAETLSRLCPFVDELLVDARHSTDRSPAIAREYGARLLGQRLDDAGQSDGNGQSSQGRDWVICLHPGEHWSEEEVRQLRTFLGSVGDETHVVALDVQSVSDSASLGTTRRELRVFRRRAGLLPALLDNSAAITKFLAEHGRQQVAAPVTVRLLGQPGIQLPPSPPTGIWEPWLEAYVPRQGDVFVDIGANIGTWTKWLATRYREVHAIEPNPVALDELRRGLPSNVSIHEWGAWDQEETVRFNQFSLSVHLTAYFSEEGIHTGPRTGTIELACRPIDSITAGGKVDFIKCDTEGAEVRCLRGATKTIERDRPWLLVECHSSENFMELMKLLSDWRYLITIVRDPNYEPFSRLWYEHCWLSCQPAPPVPI